MAKQRYKGYETARSAGDLETTPDIRFILCMSGFSFGADSVNLADGTLDEFDGANYVRYDATSVVSAYDSGSGEWRITCDNGDGDEFGTSVGPGSEAPSVLVCYLHVDGTAANDVILASSDDGSFVNGNGGDYGLTLPNDVAVYSGNDS